MTPCFKEDAAKTDATQKRGYIFKQIEVKINGRPETVYYAKVNLDSMFVTPIWGSSKFVSAFAGLVVQGVNSNQVPLPHYAGLKLISNGTFNGGVAPAGHMVGYGNDIQVFAPNDRVAFVWRRPPDNPQNPSQNVHWHPEKRWYFGVRKNDGEIIIGKGTDLQGLSEGQLKNKYTILMHGGAVLFNDEFNPKDLDLEQYKAKFNGKNDTYNHVPGHTSQGYPAYSGVDGHASGDRLTRRWGIGKISSRKFIIVSVPNMTVYEFARTLYLGAKVREAILFDGGGHHGFHAATHEQTIGFPPIEKPQISQESNKPTFAQFCVFKVQNVGIKNIGEAKVPGGYGIDERNLPPLRISVKGNSLEINAKVTKSDYFKPVKKVTLSVMRFSEYPSGNDFLGATWTASEIVYDADPNISLKAEDIPGGSQHLTQLFKWSEQYPKGLAIVIRSFDAKDEIISEHAVAVKLERGIRVGFLMDGSGSIATSDEKGFRKIAVTGIGGYLLEKYPDNAALSLVQFSEEATTLLNWSSDNNAFRSAVNSLSADKDTNFNVGLGMMLNKFSNLPEGAKKTVFFFSDGKHNVGELDPNYWADAFKKSGITIHSIGLGDVDWKILSGLAQATGGRYCYARNINDLIRQFLMAFIEDRGEEIVDTCVQQLVADQGLSSEFYLHSSGSSTLQFYWSNAGNQPPKINLVLPDGTVINAQNASSYGIEVVASDNSLIFIVPDAIGMASGNSPWRYQVIATGGSGAITDVSVVVSEDEPGDSRIWFNVDYLAPYYYTFETIEIKTRLFDGGRPFYQQPQGTPGFTPGYATVTARVVDPSGTANIYQLKWNEENPGEFSVDIEPSLYGDYLIDIEAQGKDFSGKLFTRRQRNKSFRAGRRVTFEKADVPEVSWEGEDLPVSVRIKPDAVVSSVAVYAWHKVDGIALNYQLVNKGNGLWQGIIPAEFMFAGVVNSYFFAEGKDCLGFAPPEAPKVFFSTEVKPQPLPWLAQFAGGTFGGSCWMVDVSRRKNDGAIWKNAGRLTVSPDSRQLNIVRGALTADPRDGGLWVVNITEFTAASQKIELVKIASDGRRVKSFALSSRVFYSAFDPLRERLWFVAAVQNIPPASNAAKLMSVDIYTGKEEQYPSIKLSGGNISLEIGSGKLFAVTKEGICRIDSQGNSQVFVKGLAADFLVALPDVGLVCLTSLGAQKIIWFSAGGQVKYSSSQEAIAGVRDLEVDFLNGRVWVLSASTPIAQPNKIICFKIKGQNLEKEFSVDAGGNIAYFWSIVLNKFVKSVWAYATRVPLNTGGLGYVDTATHSFTMLAPVSPRGALWSFRELRSDLDLKIIFKNINVPENIEEGFDLPVEVVIDGSSPIPDKITVVLSEEDGLPEKKEFILSRQGKYLWRGEIGKDLLKLGHEYVLNISAKGLNCSGAATARTVVRGFLDLIIFKKSSLPQVHPAGKELAISIEVDQGGSPADKAYVYARRKGENNWTRYVLTKQGSYGWSGKLPASLMQKPGVQVYFRARSEGAEGLLPEDAPEKYFEIAIKDEQVGQIELINPEVPKENMACSNVQVFVRVADTSIQPSVVELLVWNEPAAKFYPTPCIKFSDGRWQGIAPSLFCRLPELRVYFRAKADNGAVGLLPKGAPSECFKIKVKFTNKTVFEKVDIPKTAPAHKDLPIGVKFKVTSGHAFGVVLCMRLQPPYNYSSCSLELQADGWWRGKIDATLLRPGTVLYGFLFIYGTDPYYTETFGIWPGPNTVDEIKIEVASYLEGIVTGQMLRML